MDVMVLARDAEQSFAAIGPLSSDEAAEQVRKQLADRGWTYVGTAPVIAAAEFRQPSEEAEM
jgi:hypothetical protein